MFVCVPTSAQFYHTCGFMFPPPQPRHSTVPSPQASPINRTHLPSVSSPCLELLISTHLLPICIIFVISRMLHKWIHIPRRAVFTEPYSLEIHPSCCVYQSMVDPFTLLSKYSVAWMYHSLFWINYFWVVSILWLLQIRLLWTFVNRFYMNIYFHFSGANAQECKG